MASNHHYAPLIFNTETDQLTTRATMPELNINTCKKAWLSNDARFDGNFFIGVKTAGVYCRTICSIRQPELKNVRFFKTAAQAGIQGYRPCLHCRPEISPGIPVWTGISTTVSKALRLISVGELNRNTLPDFASRLGVSTRRLNGLFLKHLGASPYAVARNYRLHAAKRLIDETGLPMIDVALAAGYGSLRRFYADIKQSYGETPVNLRKSRLNSREPGHTGQFVFTLPYRPPYSWRHMLRFLSARATPGVEQVRNDVYMRTIGTKDNPGQIEVCCDHEKHQLICKIACSQSETLITSLEKIKSMFDLSADPKIILDGLKKDSALWQLVKHNPGIRVPGCWDGFEIAVRSITGQQISVAGATTVMGRIAREYGTPVDLHPDLPYLFPTAGALSALDPASLPMPGTRAKAITNLTSAVSQGQLNFNPGQDCVEMTEQLCHFKGIGPWTAQYIAMRALCEPDALLEGDLVLEKKAGLIYGLNRRMKTDELLARAEAWRPWRAYAAMHIWNL